jgi:hypothetical protein
MRNRQVKCRFCKIAELYPETDMFVELGGKHGTTPKYYHFNCYESELERRKEADKEQKEKDELNDLIKEIHNVKIINKTIWQLITDLRNGTERYQKGFKKKYKKGFNYKVIKKAYEMNRKKISYYRANKTFKDLNAEMKYCFMIIRDKINDAEKEIKRLEKIDKTYMNPSHSYSERNVEPVKEFPME